MDPFNVGIFSDHEPIMPIIRMVFAIGATMSPPKDNDSEQPQVVQVLAKTCTSNPRESYTSCEIWFSGLYPQTFGVVTQDQERFCRTLVGGRFSFDDAYKLKGYGVNKAMRGNARRRMHPGSETSGQHFKSYIQIRLVLEYVRNREYW